MKCQQGWEMCFQISLIATALAQCPMSILSLGLEGMLSQAPHFMLWLIQYIICVGPFLMLLLSH